MRKISIFLLLSILFATDSTAYGATNFDPEAHGKLPIYGSPCNVEGAVVKNLVFQFTCKKENQKLIWTGNSLQYKPPVNYLKGYLLGQNLKKKNSDGENQALICKNSADGFIVNDYKIQEGSISKGDREVLNDYYGYMGCWDGYASPRNAPSTISLTDPVGPIVSLPSGQQLEVRENISILFTEIGDAFQNGTEDGISWLTSSQVEGSFDRKITEICTQERIDASWTIKSMTPDLRTLSYNYGADWRVTEDPDSVYDSGRITSEPYKSLPLKVFVWELYYDDINGDFGTGNWRRLIVNEDGTISHIISHCAVEDESELPKINSWALEIAPKQVKAPTGKVDKKSNAYKTMLVVGRNFAKVSMATDSAKSQCLSAMSTGMIKARGIPQYLGAQARQLQSYLRTPSGFQGCVDGFGR